MWARTIERLEFSARVCLCLIALWLSGGAPDVEAAEVPVIRASTLHLDAEGRIVFQFEAAPGELGGFEVESAIGLGDAATWQVRTQLPMTELAPGLYEVVIPWQADSPSSFYRIVAWGSGGVAPLLLNEVLTGNVSGLTDAEGRRWDWIEIHNPADAAVDLAGYGLTDDETIPQRWQFPSVLIQPGGFVVVFASGLGLADPAGELHANFKLDAGGELLLLTAPNQSTVDRIQLPALDPDQSVGRLPNAGDAWHVYSPAQTTPGAANPTVSVGPVILPPRFAMGERFFPEGTSLSVVLEPASANQVIRYTIDGSPVTVNSPVYNTPLELNRTTVVRAVAFEGDAASEGIARTFFVGAAHGLPIVSLAAEPGHFEFRDGYLYGLGSRVLGGGGEVLQTFPFYGSNAWQDREIEVAVEFYEPDHRLGFQLEAGLKIFGGWGSRGYPQKSLALFARQKYGHGKINHQVFPDKPIEQFEALVLRNSGNDNQSTHQTPPRPPIQSFGPVYSYGSYFVNSSFTLMRDAMMQRLLRGLDLDTQAYRPAVLYVNGEYWGIYNVREKINEHYVIANHGLAKGQFDLIEGYGSVSAGDNVVNQAMRNFIAARDLQYEPNYTFVAENYVDIDNFIDYHLAVIYFQNFDIGNIKSWRPRVPKGLFRWIVYDQDYGFNLWDPQVYLPAMARDYADYDNMFNFYTAGSGTGTGWPNEGGRTLLLRRLLTNTGFKERFIRRCADLLNGPFREDRVQATIQEMAAVIRPEIPRHLQRWSWSQIEQLGFARPHQPEYRPFAQDTWESHIEVLLDFARTRPAKLRQDCMAHFGLSEGLTEVSVYAVPAGSGRVQFNSMVLADFPWSGICFRDYPITLTAIPKPGYRFVGWTGAGGDQPRLVSTLPADRASFTAQFELLPSEPPTSPAVIVTELQYHPSSEQDSGDWVELYNRGDQAVELEGWILRDDNDDHDFLIPKATLPPGSHLVLCQDAARFGRIHPAVTNLVGDFVFGLGNGGDTIRLFDPTGVLMLSFSYGDVEPWPIEADGTGYTLQLIDTGLYSVDPSAWTFSAALGGSPGWADP